MKRKIVTITFNDLSISWGPAVHYLELWDSFYNLFNNQYEIIGYAPYWENNSTIIPVKFNLNKIKVPNIPLVRQLYFDFILAFTLIKHRLDIVYIRMSSYSILTFFALKLLKIKPILELNGISEYDLFSLFSDEKNLLVYPTETFNFKVYIFFKKKIFFCIYSIYF
jgi:hypothetical protein